jgi:hypothetical protein
MIIHGRIVKQKKMTFPIPLTDVSDSETAHGLHTISKLWLPTKYKRNRIKVNRKKSLTLETIDVRYYKYDHLEQFPLPYDAAKGEKVQPYPVLFRAQPKMDTLEEHGKLLLSVASWRRAHLLTP